MRPSVESTSSYRGGTNRMLGMVPCQQSPNQAQSFVGYGTSPHFSQGSGVLSGDCQKPKEGQRLGGNLRSLPERQSVFLRRIPIAPARRGKVLNGLVNCGARDAARGRW